MDLIVIIKYVFLGLLQGFTEPIPISSSGHLVIAQEALGVSIEGMSFAVLVNFASLFAVLLVYKSDVLSITKNTFNFALHKKAESKDDFMFVVYLVLATIPAGVIGILFNDYISEKLSGIHIIGFTLLVTAAALWTIRNLKGTKGDHQITLKDAVIIGLAQMIALVPGISRSGATIVAALGLGLKQETALKFSFFLYIPVSVGAGLLGFTDLMKDPDMPSLWLPYMLAFIASFLMSYLSLKWFMGIMAKGNLKYFAIYCIFVGFLVLFLL